MALEWFERRKSEKEHKTQSINKLRQLIAAFLFKYETQMKHFEKLSESTNTGFSTDISEDDSELLKIVNDEVFWDFKKSAQVRILYNTFKTSKEAVKVRTVGEAREELSALIAQLKIFKNECEKIL